MTNSATIIYLAHANASFKKARANKHEIIQES